MIKLIQCEFLKIRRKHIFLTLLVITAAGLLFSLYGDYSGDFIQKNGWFIFLYQLPLANAIFFPIAALVISSRLADNEHKALAFKQLFTIEKRSKIYDTKLIIGLSLMLLSVLLYWIVILIFGKIIGFAGEIPLDLYLRYLVWLALQQWFYIFYSIIFLCCLKTKQYPFLQALSGHLSVCFPCFCPNFLF